MKTIYMHSNILKKMLFKTYWSMMLLPLICLMVSCEEFVEVDPPHDELVTATVFENDQTALSAIDGVYSRMMQSIGFASGYAGSITNRGGVYSDELISYAPSDPFYTNSLDANNSYVRINFWKEPYEYIYTVNNILEGLEVSKGVSATMKSQLEGEARFIRAFCYFYLVNYFGDVPLHLSTDYRENTTRPRTPTSEVYQQIVEDLKQAQDLLPEDYTFSNGERIRPNAYAANALLARTYLYTGNWTGAAEASSEVINANGIYVLEGDLNKVFLKNNAEAIWQLKPVVGSINTWEGFRFIMKYTPPRYEGISNVLLTTFEEGDQRKSQWIGHISDGQQDWYFPYKYKVWLQSNLEEYSMVLRLAEQYLIRAEARAQLGDKTGALQDLNSIRSRAELDPLSDVTSGELLDAILKERFTELSTEWGHRWLDLKRTGKANEVLSAIKPEWVETDLLFPIPQEEIARNPKVTQNPGY